jgi:Icc-related predicted phosphoesterase
MIKILPVGSVFATMMRILCFNIITIMLFSVNSFSASAPRLHEVSLINFEKQAALVKADDWRFVFMGDNRGDDEKFEEILQRAAQFKPLFILHGGDITESGTAEELAHFLKIVQRQKELPPIFIVRGNHEGNVNEFEKQIGPLNYVIDSPRLSFRLVVVDNADYSLKSKELSFLATKLDQSRQNQFVAMHIPPKTERWPKHTFENGKNELVKLMTERKVKMGLFAHIHLFDKDVSNGIPLIISGGAGAALTWFGYTGDAEYHFVVVEIKNGKVSYRVENP